MVYGRGPQEKALEKSMSETLENEVIAEALAVIDRSLETLWNL